MRAAADGPSRRLADVVRDGGPSDVGVEVRSVSSTGGEKGVKVQRYDLIPPRALALLAEHYGRGALKYDDHNWRRGYEWSKSYSALMRHLQAHWAGEDVDEETGSLHLTAVAWHALTMLEFMAGGGRFAKFDDRFVDGDEWDI